MALTKTKKEAVELIESLTDKDCRKVIRYINSLCHDEPEVKPDRKFRKLDKVSLIDRCAKEIDNAEKLCSLFDRWTEEENELHELNKRMRKQAGLPELGKIICMADMDVFHLWDGRREKKESDYRASREEIGEENLRYVLMMLYAGADLDRKVWTLPGEDDPRYKNSVIRLLYSDQEDYCRFHDPSYMVLSKNSWILSDLIRSGIDVVRKATA